jgi:hypothetical protein
MISGKPHGKGKTTYKNGDFYEGEYGKGKRQGYGIYTFADGEKYEGQWFQDQQHGKGTYYFSNNNRYEGLWFRDYQQGHGVMYYYNGDKYDGTWKQDKREGKVGNSEESILLVLYHAHNGNSTDAHYGHRTQQLAQAQDWAFEISSKVGECAKESNQATQCRQT